MIEKKQINKSVKDAIVGKESKIKTKENKEFFGKIIFETKNTIKIQTQKGVKTLIKKNIEITIDKKKIKGEKITKRTEDRIKTR